MKNIIAEYTRNNGCTKVTVEEDGLITEQEYKDKVALNDKLSLLHKMKEEGFVIRSYGFGQLAQMYYPDHNYDSALRLFRREMYDTRDMWQAMQDVGYKENTKTLTRSQVRTIVRFLGEP